MSAAPEHTPVPVPEGYRVGDWTVERPLGSGAFATVYAARRTAPAAPGHPSAPTGLPARAALKFLPTGTHTPVSCAICGTSPNGRSRCCGGCARPT